jgi:mRNA interferase MazF
MAMVVNRFDVYLTNLDPTVGSEIQKTRPCLIISPDEMNRHIRTVIVAPMTTAGKEYPTRIECNLKGKKGAYRFRSDTNNRQNETYKKHWHT